MGGKKKNFKDEYLNKNQIRLGLSLTKHTSIKRSSLINKYYFDETIVNKNKVVARTQNKDKNRNKPSKFHHDDVSMPMNIHKQNKHIPGTKESKNDETNSYFIVSSKYLDDYYRSNIDKIIEIDESGNKYLKFPIVVGYAVNKNTGEKTLTHMVKLHYSSTGYHMVPHSNKRRKNEK